MEYTKGEWYLEEETGLVLSLPDGADSPIIVASIGGSQNPITPKTFTELKANAHLIAAAPRMYEALKVASTRIHNSIRYEPAGEYRVMIQKDLRQIDGMIKDAGYTIADAGDILKTHIVKVAEGNELF